MTEAPAAAPAAPAAPADAAPAAEPAAEPAAADGGLVVYGIYKAGDQTWFIDEGDAAKAAVEELGGTFTYVDAKMSPEEELKAIDNAIANKASGIVMCTSDQTLSQAVVDKCKEAGIPVVAADDALEDGSGTKLAPWVGINGYVIGEANGAWLADYVKANDLASKEDCGLLIMTMDTVSSCVPRAEGEMAKFTELVPEFDSARIFKADYDGTTEKGNTASAAIFTAHPEIKTWLVTGANEEGTIGAVRALETAGLDKDACVVGLGAYMAKDEWNNKGADGTCMKASAYFSSDSVGRGSVDVLMQVINGGNPPMETAVDAIVVTPENYKDVMLKNLEIYRQAVGERIQVIWISGTDFGTQNGLFLSQNTFRTLYKPHYKKITDRVHKNTGWKTFFHTCGCVNDLLDDLWESGVDCLNPVQFSAMEPKGMSPRRLKDEYGDKFTFWGGGVDTQRVLPFGAPDEVREQVAERVRILNEGGGYIFNPIHNVVANVPAENLVAMYETVIGEKLR